MSVQRVDRARDASGAALEGRPGVVWPTTRPDRSSRVGTRITVTRGFALVLCALAVGVAAASRAGATLGAPVFVSASGESAEEPQVAVDASGNAVFVWRRFDGTTWRVQTAARSAAGALSAVQTLSASGLDASNPQVAIDANGNAVFSWELFDGANFRVQTRARSAAGTLSSVKTLSGAGQDASQSQVAVDALGDALLVWKISDGSNDRVQARWRSAGGTLQPTQTVSGAGQDASQPEVAIDSDGDAVLAWRRFDGTHWRVQARARAVAGALSAVQTLSEAGQNAVDPNLAVDAGGDAILSWRRFDDSDFRVQAVARSAAGALGPVRTLSDAGQNVLKAHLAVNGGGDAVFVWSGIDGSNFRIEARARSAAGALSPVQIVSDEGSDPQAAIDADGDAIFAWERAVSVGGGSGSVAEARARSAAGVLSAVQSLSSADGARDVRVGIDADGGATVAWLGHDGTNWRVKTVTGAAAAAFAAPLNLSASGQQAGGSDVAIDADGDAIFTWTRFDADGTDFRIEARARSAAGVLGSVRTLSPPGPDALLSEVGVDPDGDAVFVWRGFDGTNWRVQARARSAAGALSPVQTLSPQGQDAFDPQVGVDADGDAVVTWARFDGTNWRVQARARSAAGALSAVQTLSPAGQDAYDGDCGCRGPQVGVDPDGDAVFVWPRLDGTNWRVQARARSAAGTLSSVKTLSGAGQDADDHQVAVEADGDAVFSWTRFDGSRWRAQASVRSAAGVLSGVQTLSGAGKDAFSPQVAVDADGDAIFTWSGFESATFSGRVEARARTAAGTLGAVQIVSADGENTARPQVAVDADGDAIFVWVGDSDLGSGPIRARERRASGALSAIQTLTSDRSASEPLVAVAADGDPASVWTRRDNEANRRIQAAMSP